MLYLFFCIGIIVASRHICGSIPSCQVLLKISSSLYNAGCPRLTIISLVIPSGPGDFFNFRFDSALVNSSYDNGEFITVDTLSDSVILLCSVRTYFVCVAQLVYYLLLCRYQQKCWLLVSHGPSSCLVEVLSYHVYFLRH